MISRHVVYALAVFSLALPAAASAQSLLGVVGSGDSGALVTLNSGNAGDSGLVNLGLGGDQGLVTTNVGAGSEPLANASVLGPNGVADVNVNLGDVGTRVNLGGPNIVDVNVNLPRGGNGGNGRNGINGTNGGNGAIGLATRGGSAGGVTASCPDANANQLMSLFQSSSLSGWDRATGIQIVPVRVCADLRRQFASWLAANGDYHRMVGAVAHDALINAALGRTQYSAGHVLGVHRNGGTLTVYVF